MQSSHDNPQLDKDCPSHEAPPAYATPQNMTSMLCYTAQITVSLDATSTSLLVPTFHSCLITRAYDLELKISLPGSTISLGPSMQIKIPVRMMSEVAATRRDSAVLLKEALGDELGQDPLYKDLGIADLEDPPPGYQ